MRISELIEARKNPDKNPKISVWDYVNAELPKADEIADVSNMFVSFTTIDKLGINPNSTYNTPLGIYAYPGEYVQYKARYNTNDLPFAGGSEYANVFKVTGNIVNLSELSSADELKYHQQLSEVYATAVKPLGVSWKTAVDTVYDLIIESDNEARVKSPGGKLWYIMMKLTTLPTRSVTYAWNTKPHIAWNSLFRRIGIDGCIDNGDGIIHPVEPTQAVFFSKTVIKNNVRLLNKWTTASINMGTARGMSAQHAIGKLAKMTDQELEDYVKSVTHGIKYVKQPSEELQLAAVGSNANSIQHIKNPTERVQLLAITKVPSTIKYITNPSEAIQLAAVAKAAISIQHIDNPTEKVQRLAIKQEGNAMIDYIKNPHPNVVKLVGKV
jgi:hypothetical protein